jgi:hypothetical protein
MPDPAGHDMPDPAGHDMPNPAGHDMPYPAGHDHRAPLQDSLKEESNNHHQGANGGGVQEAENALLERGVNQPAAHDLAARDPELVLAVVQWSLKQTGIRDLPAFLVGKIRNPHGFTHDAFGWHPPPIVNDRRREPVGGIRDWLLRGDPNGQHPGSMT